MSQNKSLVKISDACSVLNLSRECLLLNVCGVRSAKGTHVSSVSLLTAFSMEPDVFYTMLARGESLYSLKGISKALGYSPRQIRYKFTPSAVGRRSGAGGRSAVTRYRFKEVTHEERMADYHKLYQRMLDDQA